MAITKKTNAKKTISKVKSTVKKSLRKKSASKKIGPMQTLRLSRNDHPFMTTRITRQTVYWAILLVYIMVLQIWILNIQLDIIQITDSITAQVQQS